MEDREAFGLAMAALGANARTEVTPEQLNLYWAFLADLTDEELRQATARWIRHQRWFPQVGELLELARPHVDHAADAVRAFEAVIKTGTHTPLGTRWNHRRIAEVVGPAAAEAYMAAGASTAFETEQGERDLPFLRKRFVESYVDAVEAIGRGQELAGAVAPQLPAGSPAHQLIVATVKKLAMPGASTAGDAH